MQRSKHMVKLEEDTFQRISKYGKYGDTFDDIVNRLLDEVEKKKK